MSNKLYVGNLPYQIEESEMEKEFGAFGSVKSVKIIKDFDSGRSKGFGFVEMDSADEAQQCIENLDGKDFSGRPLRVNIAKERTDNRSNSAGGGNARRW
jgi:cold-inducible RNA-binding protein